MKSSFLILSLATFISLTYSQGKKTTHPFLLWQHSKEQRVVEGLFRAVVKRFGTCAHIRALIHRH